MKETKFIEQNKQKWSDFESLSQNKQKDSNLYSKLFIQLTDDLSYARTFYGNRSVRVYLNNLAQHIFHKIFSGNKKKKSFFRDFWLEDVPSIMYLHRKELLVSFLILIVSISIGILTYRHDPTFAKKMLGSSYLQMTAENIAKNDPMAVYKDSNPVDMFVQIVLNNLQVDVLTFFSGIILGIGSIFVLIRNGLMLAAFQYYFIIRGLFWESFLAVWLHGTLEISAMIICGAAGIVLGNGIVFPGTYSRMQSFLSSAQRATKIFLSILPITIIAAVIESFLTRYTQAPNLFRLGLILASLAFILGYYVYLPWIKKRRGTLRLQEAEKVLPENFPDFKFYKIKKVSEIIVDTFRLFRKYMGFFIGSCIKITLVVSVLGFVFNKIYLLDKIYLQNGSFSNLENYILDIGGNRLIFIFPFFFTFLSLLVGYIFYIEFSAQQKNNPISFFKWGLQNWKSIIFIMICQVIFYAWILSFHLDFNTMLFIFPIQYISTFIFLFPYTEKRNVLSTFFTTLKSGVMNLFVVNIVFLIFFSGIYFLISMNFVETIVFETITMNLSDKVADSDTFYIIYFMLINTFMISVVILFLCLFQGVFYFSQKEKHSAEGLIQQLDKIGMKKKHV